MGWEDAMKRTTLPKIEDPLYALDRREAEDGVNELDPRHLPDENPDARKVPLFLKVYGILCFVTGALALVALALFTVAVLWTLFTNAESVAIGDAALAMFLGALVVAVVGFIAVALVYLGVSLLRNRRRNASRWANVLVGFSIAELVLMFALVGISSQLIAPFLQTLFLIVLSVALDPSLAQERELQRKLRRMEDKQAKEEGRLGRDETGKGYIKLNFFNLFWVLIVCSIIGLVFETAFVYFVSNPGVLKDRACTLYGPFSLIYGVGAVILTIALNRLYDDNPFLVFLASALIGATFEALVSWLMEMALGARAWDYTGTTIFGIPDPVAIMAGGRTATPYACAWGLLGLWWVRWALPKMLWLINRIPWKWRYSVTSVCAVLMLVNCIMTVQALDCWFMRVSGEPIETEMQAYYAEHYPDEWMEARFETIEINPGNSSRVSE